MLRKLNTSLSPGLTSLYCQVYEQENVVWSKLLSHAEPVREFLDGLNAHQLLLNLILLMKIFVPLLNLFFRILTRLMEISSVWFLLKGHFFLQTLQSDF